jgi:hypothetical protein
MEKAGADAPAFLCPADVRRYIHSPTQIISPAVYCYDETICAVYHLLICIGHTVWGVQKG